MPGTVGLLALTTGEASEMLNTARSPVHAWDYRRLVLKSLPLSAVNSRDSELGFTKRKIESNFSNYSAWHQRGKVLGEGLFSSEAESNSGSY